MTTIKIYVDGEKIKLVDAPVISSGDVQAATVSFEFSPDWAVYTKTAVFSNRDMTEDYGVVISANGTAFIPAEVLAHVGYESSFWIGVKGVSGTSKYTSEMVRYKLKVGASDGSNTPATPTQSEYTQIMDLLHQSLEREVDDTLSKPGAAADAAAAGEVRNDLRKVESSLDEMTEYRNIFYFTDLTTRTIAGNLTISFPDASTIHLNGECIDPAGSNRRWCIGVMGGSDSPSAGTVRNSTSTYTGKFGFSREVTGGENSGFRLAYSAENRGAGTAISAGSVVDIENAYIQLAIYPGVYNDVTLKVCLSEGGLIGYVPHKLSAVDEVARAKLSDLEYVNNTLGYTVNNNLYSGVTLAAIKARNTTGVWNGNVYSKDGINYTVNDDISVDVECTSSYSEASTFQYPYITLSAGNVVYFNNDNPCEMRLFRSGTSKWIVRPGVTRLQRYVIDQDGDYGLVVTIQRKCNFRLAPPVLLIGGDKACLDTRVKALEQPVPDYYFDDNYLTNKIGEINDNMASVGRHGETFVFITDLHWNQNNMKRSPALLKYIKSKTNIDNVICGGDILDNGTRALMRRTTLECLDAFYDPAIPFIVANGNHDTNENGQFGSPEAFGYDEEFALIYKRIARYVTMPIDDSMMMIYDRPDTKTRFIVLDTKYDGTLNTNDNDALAQYLNDMEEGWSAVVIAHWLFNTVDGIRRLNDNAGQAVAGFCDAYNARSNFGGRDFSNGRGYVRAIICGHTHYDAEDKTSGGIPAFCTTGDNIARDNDTERFPREAGTITEQAFDIVTIDYNTGNIKTVRIGSGVNRSYTDGRWE